MPPSLAPPCRHVVDASGHLRPRAAGILRWPLAGTDASKQEVVVTFVEVNGLPTWHGVHGSGHPILLLHGASAGSAPTPRYGRLGATH